MKKVTPETALKRSIKDFCAYAGVAVWSILQGLGSTPGIADLIGVYRGRAVAIEVKAGNNTQSDDQIAFQAAWERAGGIYILARRVEDVAAGLGIKTLGWL